MSKMKSIFERLKELHPDLAYIRIDEGDVELVFDNDRFMATVELAQEWRNEN